MHLEMNVKLRQGSIDLAAHFAAEQHTGLLGQSGAGKTLVLTTIAGVLQPQSGYIILDNKVLYDSRSGIHLPREQRPIGAVLQTAACLTDATVHDYLSSIDRQVQKPQRMFTLSFIGMLLDVAGLFEQRLDQLNQAEYYRVTLAGALLKSPRLLLLDDTFALIGQRYRDSLLPILRHLQHEFGLSVLYASQSLADILSLTDRLVVLDQGRVLRSGSLSEIARQQTFLRYLGLSQVDNVLPMTLREHDSAGATSLGDCGGLRLRLPFRPHHPLCETYPVSVRANDIALSLHYLQGISIQNQIKGRICALIQTPLSVLVQVDCGRTLLVEITTGACRDLGLQEGQTVYCLIKTQAIVYLSELDRLPHNRIVNYNGMFYFAAADSGLAELQPFGTIQ